MVSIWPIMRPGGDNWQEMRDRRSTCWATRLPTMRSARPRGPATGSRPTRWPVRPRRRRLVVRLHRAVRSRLEGRGQARTGRALAHQHRRSQTLPRPRVHQRLFAAPLSRASTKVSARHTCAKRVVNLTRSAYPGQQRYATITWSGDVTAHLGDAAQADRRGLNFCVTGSPYWTLDIGGVLRAA